MVLKTPQQLKQSMTSQTAFAKSFLDRGKDYALTMPPSRRTPTPVLLVQQSWLRWACAAPKRTQSTLDLKIVALHHCVFRHTRAVTITGWYVAGKDRFHFISLSLLLLHCLFQFSIHDSWFMFHISRNWQTDRLGWQVVVLLGKHTGTDVFFPHFSVLYISLFLTFFWWSWQAFPINIC